MKNGLCSFLHCPVVPCIPLREFAEALAEWGGWAEAEVLFEGRGVCVSDGYVAGLHGYEFFVRLEVVILWKHACCEEFFLQNGDEVQQVLRRIVADVIDFVRWNRQSVLAGLFFWCMLHDADNAFYDVIDKGEVAFAVAVVENLDGLALTKLVGEAEVGHVRTTGRTIDGEESQAGAWDVVELAVSVSHQLVALLCCGIEADGIVHFVVGGVGNLLVTAVNAAAGGIDEMLDTFIWLRVEG